MYVCLLAIVIENSLTTTVIELHELEYDGFSIFAIAHANEKILCVQ